MFILDIWFPVLCFDQWSLTLSQQRPPRGASFSVPAPVPRCGPRPRPPEEAASLRGARPEEARPPPEHAVVVLQRLGQLAVEHLELRDGRQRPQHQNQPHQLGGQLLHRRQHRLRPLAGCCSSSRQRERGLPVR